MIFKKAINWEISLIINFKYKEAKQNFNFKFILEPNFIMDFAFDSNTKVFITRVFNQLIKQSNFKGLKDYVSLIIIIIDQDEECNLYHYMGENLELTQQVIIIIIIVTIRVIFNQYYFFFIIL